MERSPKNYNPIPGQLLIFFALVILFFFIFFTCESCQAQTIDLKFTWKKNPEPDMHSYDLFIITNPDSVYFYSLNEWPADTSIKNVYIDSTIHYPNLLATAAHIYSPVDTMLVEYRYPRSQTFARAYIVAVDSVGNQSALGTSINIFYIGDRDAPRVPENTIVEVKF